MFLPRAFVLICTPFLLSVVEARADSTESNLTFAARVDLDGNGTRESIQLSRLPATGKTPEGAFRLTVNGQSLVDSDGEHVEGFGIADIDRRDRFKEIFVRSLGIGDDTHFTLYRLRNGRLQRVGKVWEATFDGNGIVRCQSFLSFATAEVKFRLNRAGRLEQIKQTLYPLSYPLDNSPRQRYLRVLKPLALLTTRSSKSKISATIPREGRVKLVATDLNDWLWVESKNGARGWVSVRMVNEGALEGLIFAG